MWREKSVHSPAESLHSRRGCASICLLISHLSLPIALPLPSLSFLKQSTRFNKRIADWPLLPSNLVDRVAGFLSAADQARMAAVCKPWREAITDGLCRRRPARSIWILVHKARAAETLTPKGDCHVASFSEGMRSYYFPLPIRKERVQIMGSCGGWIMLRDKLTRLHAFNPISRTTLSFPAAGTSITGVVFLPRRRAHGRRDERPPVAAIWTNIYGLEPRAELSFSHTGDDVWTPLPVPSNIHFNDIAVHKGKLYALGRTNQIVIFDMDGENLSSSPPAIVTTSAMPAPVMLQQYIGVVSGEIVVAGHWIGSVWRVWARSMPEFGVIRLQKDGERGWKWARTRDLAGHAILLDHNGFMALRVEDHKELEANTIYFFDGCYVTVSNLEKETTSVIRHSFPTYSVPSWFHPSS